MTSPTGPNRTTRSIAYASFGVGYAIAGACCALATALALYGPAEPSSLAMFALLGLGLVLILALGALTGVRLIRVMLRPREGAPAPRLHLRFVALFSFAALTPAVLMAVFFGVLLSRGLETWFGEQVESSVESAGETAQFYLEQIEGQVRLDAAAAAVDLSQEEVRAIFEQGQQQFQEVLASLAEFRAFKAAYVIVPGGQIVARYEAASPPEYRAPSPDELAAAQIQAYVEVDRQAEVLRALAPLQDYPIEVYFYGVPDVNPALFEALRETANAVGDFEDARTRRGRIQTFFSVIYFEATLLILVGAVWLALSAAGRVANPIGRLVEAADRVGKGDLAARVDVGDEADEVSTLGRAFNLMTGQIERQRGELVHAHAESESRRRLLEAVLAGASAGVLSVDRNGVVGLANRSALELLDKPEKSLLEAPLREVAPALAEIVELAMARPGDTVEEQIDLPHDDSTLVLNVRAAMDAEADGWVVVTFDDITRLIAAQRNAAWRDVARRIAHEIKNPLTPIQLSAERLRRRYRPDDDSAAEIFDRCTDTIVRQVGDIGRMVDEFSAFARMPTPRMEHASLQELANETAFARRVASPEIELTLDAPEDNIEVLCDERLAQQALLNILKNAAESITGRHESDETAPKGRIAVHLCRTESHGVIEIADNGLGWPPGARDRLTEPYMTTREKGTGLGLAIVARIMEDHGGRLDLESPTDPQISAVVRLCFPLTDPAADTKAAE